MSDFTINTANIASSAESIATLKQTLSSIENEILFVSNGIRSNSASFAILANRLKVVANNVDDEKLGAELLSQTLYNIVNRYKEAENTIISGANIRNNTPTDSNSEAPVPEQTDDKSDLSLEDAIDFLNNISLSTSIDGAVLATIQYLIGLYNSLADTSLLSGLGTATGIAGLITGVAADIMYALDAGSTMNALLADIIVDVALFGIGVGAQALGEAVGTAVGGPVGTVVGNFVGGLVGNGVSIAMNIDWNGDEEGGVGKDAVSDWIDNQLDKLYDDREIAPAF